RRLPAEWQPCAYVRLPARPAAAMLARSSGKAAPMPSIDFWYEFASNYSYLSAMRIEDLAKEAGVGVRWRPFLLGPVFASQGLNTSPFNVFPVKGRAMIRD